MTIRYSKIVFVLLVSLLCLFYALQNVINLEACYQAFSYVLSAADHSVYAASAIPIIESPLIIWSMLTLVVALEFIGGLVAAKGAWDMWNAKSSPANEFHSSKKYALLGCTVGIVIWFGLFGVFGGAAFQMWQTEIGGNSMDDAFQFFVACALVFVIVNSKED